MNRRALTLTASLLFAFAALIAGSSASRARTVEQVVALPVHVEIRGQTISQPITLTVFRDDTRGPSPFLILNHGRPVHVADHVKMGRVRYSANAAYFVALGFAVFVPTRIGYGVSGGPDIEDLGSSCAHKDYPPSYEAAAQQSLAVIAYAKSLSYVDTAQGIVLGQSFGGATAIALAAKNLPGVIAAVNFAGGGGGNPETRPERPCGNDRLTELFASYGATARIPSLWLYSENDRYFGTEKPRAWFEAFTARGGAGRFVQLPPSGTNGHSSFTANPNAWHKPFQDFIASLGLRWAAPPSRYQD